MIISNFCVGFVIFIGLLVITGMLGWLNMLVADEEKIAEIIEAVDASGILRDAQ